MILRRRGFLGALSGLVAAPALVRAENVMPVKAVPPWLGMTDAAAADLAMEMILAVNDPYVMRGLLGRAYHPGYVPLVKLIEGATGRRCWGAVEVCRDGGQGVAFSATLDSKEAPGVAMRLPGVTFFN